MYIGGQPIRVAHASRRGATRVSVPDRRTTTAKPSKGNGFPVDTRCVTVGHIVLSCTQAESCTLLPALDAGGVLRLAFLNRLVGTAIRIAASCSPRVCKKLPSRVTGRGHTVAARCDYSPARTVVRCHAATTSNSKVATCLATSSQEQTLIFPAAEGVNRHTVRMPYTVLTKVLRSGCVETKHTVADSTDGMATC